MDWTDVLRRLAQGLPLQPAPPPGGVGDTTEPLPADWMTLSPPVQPSAGTIPFDKRLSQPVDRGKLGMHPDLAVPGWGSVLPLPAELEPPRLRGSLPQSLLPGEIMQTYLQPQPVVNDNAGDRNQLSEQERLEQILQQILRQNQTIWPGPMQQPTNTQDPPRLRLVQNENIQLPKGVATDWMSGTPAKPNWQLRLQNAEDDKAVQKLVREMEKAGIAIPPQLLPGLLPSPKGR